MRRTDRAHGDVEVRADRNLAGIIFLCVGIFVFSFQDVIIKSLSDRYAVHQIVFIRSFISIPLIIMIVGIDSAPPNLMTRRPFLHFLRAACMFVAYMSYYLALAAIPLADTVAIAFSAPLFITAFSVIIYRESVGIRRWLAIMAGLVGILLITRPGSGVFEPAALLAVVCALTYACSQMLARKLGQTESGGQMALYAAIFYLVVSMTLGIITGDGVYAGASHPSIQFLTRAWIVPSLYDMTLMIATGAIAAVGFYCLSQAYRIGMASVVSSFEYTGLLWAVLLGFLFWGDVPGPYSIAGITLIVASGLYVIFRETKRNRPLVSKRGRLKVRSGL